KTELAKKTNEISTALKNRQYGVFLNGKLVGGKVFKDTCKLQNEVSVEVDVDYGRPWIKRVCDKSILKPYEIFFRYYTRTGNECFGFSTGEVIMRKGVRVIAAMSNNLAYNYQHTRKKNYEVLNISY